ncbi:MAG: hypothetical protein ACREQ5_12795, partial [Candidatus Dormibacteria bacterium]
MATDSITQKLGKAKKVLADANAWDHAVVGNGGEQFVPKPKLEPKAPVKPRTDGEDIAAGLKVRQDNVHAYLAAQPKAPMYHKGGKIKKDGVQVIDAEKGETVLPKDETESKELYMEHMKGLEAGLKGRKKKAGAAPKKHEEHKSHSAPKHAGKVRHMHIHRLDDNTFMMEHEHEPAEDGSAIPNTQ